LGQGRDEGGRGPGRGVNAGQGVEAGRDEGRRLAVTRGGGCQTDLGAASGTRY
jgi:hypothetical protein